MMIGAPKATRLSAANHGPPFPLFGILPYLERDIRRVPLFRPCILYTLILAGG